MFFYRALQNIINRSVFKDSLKEWPLRPLADYWISSMEQSYIYSYSSSPLLSKSVLSSCFGKRNSFCFASMAWKWNFPETFLSNTQMQSRLTLTAKTVHVLLIGRAHRSLYKRAVSDAPARSFYIQVKIIQQVIHQHRNVLWTFHLAAVKVCLMCRW